MPGETTIRAVLGVLAAYLLVTGALALIVPDTFFDQIGNYGVENEHYVGDAGAFTFAYGLVVVVAIIQPSWRVPVLAVGAAWFLVHALNHAFDVGQARSDARGIADTVLLALGGLALGWLAVLISRAERGRDRSR